jgi:hypothetical protein
MPLREELATPLRDLHDATNLTIDSSALADSADVFCYFARFYDTKGRRLTAVRRATQFKGVLKNRLLRLTTDALKLIEDKVFKLDMDFDLLIDSANVHILRPSGFELLGNLETAVLDAVPKNIRAVQKNVAFVDFASIQSYAISHPRAARYLASICQQETKNIDKRALKELCKRTGVEIKESDGKIKVEDGQVLPFLEVLDRRRYEIELVKNSPEQYRAGSREKLRDREAKRQ